ncbi:PTS transporter subunit EIIC [Enterovibrio sp. 27052020O]|uniref:PTS transporter subunit EIIC n=1 Tax=Enterovibrio sp. 27052020O TaxID=3241166 RepID=UPI00388DA753
MDYISVAEKIIASVGGKDNIKNAEHCATRLRIVLVDPEKVDVDAAKGITEISGYFAQSGQHQFIIGTGKVSHVYAEVSQLLGKSDDSGESSGDFKQDAYANMTVMQKVVRTFADILIPLIPVLVTTGLLMGLRGLMLQLGVPFTDNGLALFSMLTDTAFAFLPVLIAYSAVKRFGGNPVLGIVVGLMMVAPQLPNAWAVAGGHVDPMSVSVFGFTIPLVGYQGTVLPAIFAGWFVAWLEQRLRRVVPAVMDLVITPFLTILIAISVIIFIVGPMLQAVEHQSTQLVVLGLDLPFGIGYMLVGALQQVITISGLHHALGVIEIGLLNETGSNPLNPLITASMAGQFGAAIAIATLLKNKVKKANAYSASVSTLFGITEPLLFGVNLQYGKAFLMGMIGGSVGGMVAYIFNVSASGMGITFIPGMLLYTSSVMDLLMYLAVIASAFCTSFVLTRINNPVQTAQG